MLNGKCHLTLQLLILWVKVSSLLKKPDRQTVNSANIVTIKMPVMLAPSTSEIFDESMMNHSLKSRHLLNQSTCYTLNVTLYE